MEDNRRNDRGFKMRIYLKDLTPEEIIKRLKRGEVIKTYYISIKMVDGIIIRFYDNGDYILNDNTYIDRTDNSYYFEEEPQ